MEKQTNPFEDIFRKMDEMHSDLRKFYMNPINASNQKVWGGIELAQEVTGYAKQTIYIKAGKGEIPNIKRAGKLWFEKSALMKWIETGVISKLEPDKKV